MCLSLTYSLPLYLSISPSLSLSLSLPPSIYISRSISLLCLSLALAFFVSPRPFRFRADFIGHPWSPAFLPASFIISHISPFSQAYEHHHCSHISARGTRHESACSVFLSQAVSACAAVSAVADSDDCYRGSPRALLRTQCVCG